ncbi:MAG: hypothetical protein GX885_07690 [Methanomicrobiales archaeon]|nr:hypothetical protein [Methanomicrobiales archaeon]
MALKGGAGIRKVFIENYRFSDDLEVKVIPDFEEAFEWALDCVELYARSAG